MAVTRPEWLAHREAHTPSACEDRGAP
jgi:hypothetical protein